MTELQTSNELTNDPDGSIFLFRPLGTAEFQKEDFAILQRRGVYRDMDSGELEARYEDLRLRYAISNRMARDAITDVVLSDIIES